MLAQAGFVHRDLSWNNAACTLERRYFWHDLELCGKPGSATGAVQSWPNGILQAVGAYTEASDILAFGRMLCTHVVSSTDGPAF